VRAARRQAPRALAALVAASRDVPPDSEELEAPDAPSDAEPQPPLLGEVASPRTKWTRRVPHPVLIGRDASLPPAIPPRPRPGAQRARRSPPRAGGVAVARGRC